jgi:hypothetical protein
MGKSKDIQPTGGGITRSVPADRFFPKSPAGPVNEHPGPDFDRDAEAS